MTEQNTDVANAEFDALKDKAEMLGISFHPNISEAKLRERIKEHEAENAKTQAAPAVADAQYSAEDDPTALVRVRVTCMNPNKRKYTGDLITVGNSKIGTLRKFVPFGHEWHIPRIMLNVLKDKEFRQSRTVKENGKERVVNEFVKEYAIEELPPLTEAELKELAQRQAMAAGGAEAL